MFKLFISIALILTVNLFGHGEVHNIIKVKDEEISKDPQNARLYFERALLHETNVDYEKALKDLDKAAELKAGMADFDFQRGRIYLATEKFPMAISSLSKSLKSNSEGNGNAHLLRGRAYRGLKDFKSACADFDKAVELAEELRPETALEQVQAHLKNPDSSTKQALKHLDNAIKRIGPSISLYNEKLHILDQKDKPLEAGDVIGEILKIVTRQEKWLITRAQLYIKAGKKSKAAEDLKKCMTDIEMLPEIVRRRKINQKMYSKML